MTGTRMSSPPTHLIAMLDPAYAGVKERAGLD